MDGGRGILMTNDGLGVSRGYTTSMFGLWEAVSSVSAGEGAEVLLETRVSERAQTKMAQQEDG